MQEFDEWVVDFVGPFNPPSRQIGAQFIITAIDYLTRWDEAAPVIDCNAATTSRILFNHLVARFGCTKILVSDQGTKFVNQLIEKLTEEFQIQHKETTPYHPQ